jgi:hypothetical protein
MTTGIPDDDTPTTTTGMPDDDTPTTTPRTPDMSPVDLESYWPPLPAPRVLLAPPPRVHIPNLVDGMLKYPDLTLVLERLTSSPSAKHAAWNENWYTDARITIGAGTLTIPNMAWCDPDQVKLVLAHFPALRVVCIMPGDAAWRPHAVRMANSLFTLTASLEVYEKNVCHSP